VSNVTDGTPERNSKIGTLRKRLLDLLQEHERDGAIPTNSRFLYYECVQRGWLSKAKTGARRPDQDLHDALTDLREGGQVPWEWIVDETRSLGDYTGFASIKDGALAYLNAIRLDSWCGKAPMVVTESRSLAGVLRDIAREYCCRIAATNGQCGGFLRTDLAPALSEGDRVIYLGDYDLAGNDIERNTASVLIGEVGELQWERLALTAEQVEQYDLPVITKRDRRFKNGGAHEAVETEAISQSVLIEILRSRLAELLPEPLEDVQERTGQQRRRLRAVLNRVRP
jgi:hypothetical protein